MAKHTVARGFLGCEIRTCKGALHYTNIDRWRLALRVAVLPTVSDQVHTGSTKGWRYS